MNESLSLLQFVALALPAIAILMQAVLNYHDLHGETSKGNTVQTEFRLLELAFLGLILAGVVFSLSIFSATTSWWTRSGILILIGALGMIFPATWFALRRGQYPSQSYDSPEAAVKASLRKSVGIIGMIAILALTISTLGIFLPSGIEVNIRGINPLIFLILPILSLFPVASNLLDFYVDKSVYQNWSSEIANEIPKISQLTDDVQEVINKAKQDKDVSRDFIVLRNECEDLTGALKSLIRNKPDSVSNSVIDELSELKKLLDNLAAVVTDLKQVQDELDDSQSRTTEAKERRNYIDAQITEMDPEDVDQDRLKSMMGKNENIISENIREINRLESKEEDLLDELQIVVNDIDEQLESINSEIQSDDKTQNL